jgi:16S rRNA (guanine527-N7)-methyltransferase
MTIEATLRSLSLDAELADKLTAFLVLFEKWNRSINLSSASTRAELTEHLIDSLHVVSHLNGRARVLDVGSGGGFPVVVAAISLPEAVFTSLEPVHKKHAFLRTAARELRLANLDARAERLEDHQGRDYDAAMSRATFDLVDWLTRARDFVTPSGIVVGFEAVPRDDLPESTERHSYELSGKRRAIVIARRA